MSPGHGPWWWKLSADQLPTVEGTVVNAGIRRAGRRGAGRGDEGNVLLADARGGLREACGARGLLLGAEVVREHLGDAADDAVLERRRQQDGHGEAEHQGLLAFGA